MSIAGIRSNRGDGYQTCGRRLVCCSDFLKNVLINQQSELLILIKLERYNKGFGNEKSQYWHTTAVIRIDQTLNYEFFPGVVNKLHEMNY